MNIILSLEKKKIIYLFIFLLFVSHENMNSSRFRLAVDGSNLILFRQRFSNELKSPKNKVLIDLFAHHHHYNRQLTTFRTDLAIITN